MKTPSDSYRIMDIAQICGTCKHCMKGYGAKLENGVIVVCGDAFHCSLQASKTGGGMISGMKANGTCDLWEADE